MQEGEGAHGGAWIYLVYAKIDHLGDFEKFIVQPIETNLQIIGDRLFDDALLKAAKLIFTHISN
jgi:hypothetical protein